MVPRFGEFCTSCCLNLPEKILATWEPSFSLSLYLGPGAPDVAGDGGAAQPDVGGGWPQPQMPVVALGTFCLGW